MVRDCSLITKFIMYHQKELKKDKEKLELHRAKFLIWYEILQPNRWFIHNWDDDYGFIIQSIPEGESKVNPKYQYDPLRGNRDDSM
jgi:hypothetical protein